MTEKLPCLLIIYIYIYMNVSESKIHHVFDSEIISLKVDQSIQESYITIVFHKAYLVY